jgi:hypothetical protein
MNYQREVIELHDFFVNWLHGKLPNTPQAFHRVEHVLSPDFLLISPDGKITNNKSLLTSIRAAHGARPSLNMWIESVQLQQQIDNLLIVTYEEWQRENDNTTARISTAVFRVESNAPQGLRWLHVHETWLAIE